ncbi:ABC transporter transmembrane domain-containing protein [Patescibacteria group bacterium]
MKLLKTKNYRKKENSDLYKEFIKRLLKEKGEVTIILILMILSAVVYVIIPFVLKDGIQKLYLIRDYYSTIIFAIILIIVGTIIMVLKEKYIVTFSHNFIVKIKKDMFRGVLKKTINKYQKIGVGKVMAYLTYNMSLVKSLVSEWGAVFIQQVLNFLILFVASFFIDIRLAILFFMILPVFILYLIIIQYIVRNYALKLMTLNRRIFENAYQTLGDFENTKISNTEKQRYFSFAGVLDKDNKIRINRVLIYQYNKIILHSINLLLVIVFVAVGGKYLHQQEMNFSEFIFFVLYIHLLFRPFELALFTSSYFEAGKIGLKTVFKYLNNENFFKIDKGKFKGNLKIENATFKHPRNKFRLSKINLDLKKGDRITIYGSNNSGKSTFTEMLMHLRKLQRGKIYLDRLDTKNLGAETIRENITLISVNYLLSSGTIFNFLISGRKEKMKEFDEKLIHLCQELNILDKVISFDSRKFQSKINRNDIRFSQSEKIKLALIRAVYRNTPIIILDNFWHSLDENTKKDISTFIKKHLFRKTIIQLSSKKGEENLLIKTDKEFELEEGKLK